MIPYGFAETRTGMHQASRAGKIKQTGRRGNAKEEPQLGLFAARDANLVREIAGMDLNAMTPLEAMNRLAELKKKAEGAG
jgi:hypothetical protein